MCKIDISSQNKILKTVNQYMKHNKIQFIETYINNRTMQQLLLDINKQDSHYTPLVGYTDIWLQAHYYHKWAHSL